LRHIPRFGIGDEEVIQFFSRPIHTVQYSALEGNRTFDIIIESTSGERLLVGSQMFDLDEWDEIGVLSIKRLLDPPAPIMVTGPPFPYPVQSLYNIIGEFDPEETCEAGLVVESEAGLMWIVAGSFPCSVNLFYPGFDQGIRMHSFQTFKYTFKRLHFYS
jgi:hypothetical protein